MKKVKKLTKLKKRGVDKCGLENFFDLNKKIYDNQSILKYGLKAKFALD